MKTRKDQIGKQGGGQFCLGGGQGGSAGEENVFCKKSKTVDGGSTEKTGCKRETGDRHNR